MSNRPQYLAASRRARVSSDRLEACAAWLDLTVLPGRPLPDDRSGLVLTSAGACLRVPGGGQGRWPAGMVDRRSDHGDRDPLLRALDLPPGARVLDGTFGLGHDALLMARAGLWVLAVERDPALLFFAQDGLRRHDPAAARRISVRCADHRRALRASTVDAIYLDPMFPAHRPTRNQTMEILRACATPAAVSDDVLRAAWAHAPRVVLRLSPGVAAPRPPGLPSARVVYSKRVRFAVWGGA